MSLPRTVASVGSALVVLVAFRAASGAEGVAPEGCEAEGVADGPDAAVPARGLDATEVTIADYARCVRAGACSAPDAYVAIPYDPRGLCNWQAPDNRARHPVNCVDASQAAAYCAWANARLPTESEWEAVAARAGKYPWGDDEPGPTRVNACGPECGTDAASKGLLGSKRAPWSSDGFPGTAPVGSFPLGDAPGHVSDLSGNVWEWTREVVAVDPPRYAVRGGAFSSVSAQTLVAKSRSVVVATHRSFAVGFRCIR